MYISVSLGRCSWQIVYFDHKLDPTDMQLAHVLNLLCLNSILDFQTALTLSVRWKGCSNCLNAFVVLALSPNWKYLKAICQNSAYYEDHQYWDYFWKSTNSVGLSSSSVELRVQLTWAPSLLSSQIHCSNYPAVHWNNCLEGPEL